MKRITNVLTGIGLALSIGFTSCVEDRSDQFPVPTPGIYDWSFQPFELPIPINDVFFVDNNLGWAVGDGGLLLGTSNGGANWDFVPISDAEEDLRGLFFTSREVGWFVGALNPGGQVSFSSSGGAFPQPQVKVESALSTVFFINDQTGWVGGENGQILHTVDGGSNWSIDSLPDPRAVFDLHFVSSSKGWAATAEGGIYRMVDGTTWQPEEVESNQDLLGIHFVDSLNGWACGPANTILKRTVDSNGIPKWVRVGASIGNSWNDISFVDTQTGWVVGDGGSVYKSTDGGENWTPEVDPFVVDYNAIHMVSSKKGWIVGDEGAILTYTPLN